MECGQARPGQARASGNIEYNLNCKQAWGGGDGVWRTVRHLAFLFTKPVQLLLLARLSRRLAQSGRTQTHFDGKDARLSHQSKIRLIYINTLPNIQYIYI
jgi:hypothetical protein